MELENEPRFLDPTEVPSTEPVIDNEKPETEEVETTEVEKNLFLTPEEVEALKEKESESEEDEDEEKDIPSKTPSGGKEKPSVYTIVARGLLEEGVYTLPIPDDFDGTPDALKAYIQKDKEESVRSGIDAAFEMFLSSMPPKLAKAVSSYADGLDADFALELADSYDKLTSIKEDQIEKDTSLQRKLYKDSLLAKGFSEEKAEKYVKKAEDLDELIDEAKDAYTDLKKDLEKREKQKKEEMARKEAEREQEQRKQLETIKSDVFATENIAGVKLTKKLQDEIYKSMTEIIGQDEYGNPMNSVMMTRSKNPLAFEKAVHFYHKIGLFNIDDKGNFKPDVSKLTSVAKTNTLKELEKTVRNESFKPGKSMEITGDSESEDILNALESIFKNVKD